jgi:hypothetical protein
MVITGKWQDGTPLLAIPNYARMNRVAQDRREVAGGNAVNYAPGATASKCQQQGGRKRRDSATGGASGTLTPLPARN